MNHYHHHHLVSMTILLNSVWIILAMSPIVSASQSHGSVLFAGNESSTSDNDSNISNSSLGLSDIFLSDEQISNIDNETGPNNTNDVFMDAFQPPP